MSIPIPSLAFSVSDLVAAVQERNVNRVEYLIHLYQDAGLRENINPALLAAVEVNAPEILEKLYQKGTTFENHVVMRAFELGSLPIIEIISNHSFSTLKNKLFVAVRNHHWHVVEFCLDLPAWQKISFSEYLFDLNVIQQAIWEERHPLLRKLFSRFDEIKTQQHSSPKITKHIASVEKIKQDLFFRAVDRLDYDSMASFKTKKQKHDVVDEIKYVVKKACHSGQVDLIRFYSSLLSLGDDSSVKQTMRQVGAFVCFKYYFQPGIDFFKQQQQVMQSRLFINTEDFSCKSILNEIISAGNTRHLQLFFDIFQLSIADQFFSLILEAARVGQVSCLQLLFQIRARDFPQNQALLLKQVAKKAILGNQPQVLEALPLSHKTVFSCLYLLIRRKYEYIGRISPTCAFPLLKKMEIRDFLEPYSPVGPQDLQARVFLLRQTIEHDDEFMARLFYPLFTQSEFETEFAKMGSLKLLGHWLAKWSKEDNIRVASVAQQLEDAFPITPMQLVSHLPNHPLSVMRNIVQRQLEVDAVEQEEFYAQQHVIRVSRDMDLAERLVEEKEPLYLVHVDSETGRLDRVASIVFRPTLPSSTILIQTNTMYFIHGRAVINNKEETIAKVLLHPFIRDWLKGSGGWLMTQWLTGRYHYEKEPVSSFFTKLRSGELDLARRVFLLFES